MKYFSKTFVPVLFLFLSMFCAPVFAFQLTCQGKTDCSIVLPADASDNLRYAAHELKIHLEEASGAKFPVVNKNVSVQGPQIVLQEKFPGLKTGEFVVRTEGKALYLLGGGESGIHFAVHDFLETDCGYIWYDARGGKKIPDLKNFRIKKLNRKRSYAFELRSLSPDWYFYRPEGHYFLYRNGINMKSRLFSLPGMDRSKYKFKQSNVLDSRGLNDFRRAYPADHTFFDYIPDVPKKSRIPVHQNKGYFKTNPEYFTMNQAGKRVVLQLCFSNPEMKAEFKKNFYEHIRKAPDSNIFSVTAFDFPGQICYCKECQAAVKKYKTNGAPVFLFVKELAEAVAKDFPEIRIFTYAYRKEQTEFPPEGLKFPDNVIVCFCPIDDDMSKGWNSRTNAETYKNLKKWKKVCKNLWLWYYVNPWTFSVISTPAIGNVFRCANDIVLAQKAGVTGCMYSHEVGLAPMIGFTELQSYVMVRLMRNPELNIDFLIDDFLKFEYGAAAPLMRKYLNELEKIAAESDVFVKWNAVYGVWNSFLPSTDTVRWQGYFDKMEKLTASDPEKNFAVCRVRVPLDLMTLRFYRRIRKDVPEFNLKVETLSERIRTVSRRATESFYTQSIPSIKNYKGKHDQMFDRLIDNFAVQSGADPKPLPKEIFGKIDPALIFEFFPGTMAKSVLVKDKDAAWGYAVLNNQKVQGFPIQILEYDAVKPLWEDIAEIHSAKKGMEGKYCFYHIGETSVTPSYEMRLHFEGYKNLFRIFPGEVWMPGTDDTVNIYISLKMTGPEYYPGSKEKNSIACDRIVFVRKTNN